jgi:GcrA cell cycle regulator
VSRPLISRWDRNTIAKLRRYWREGLSAAQIAQALGKGLTRNAVLGQVKRMRDRGADMNLRVAAHPPPEALVPVAPVAAEDTRRAHHLTHDIGKLHRTPITGPVMPVETTYDHVAPTHPDLLRIMDLQPHHCRWPLNNALGGEFYFCGARTSGAKPYCETHCAVAYAAPMNKKRNANAGTE